MGNDTRGHLFDLIVADPIRDVSPLALALSLPFQVNTAGCLAAPLVQSMAAAKGDYTCRTAFDLNWSLFLITDRRAFLDLQLREFVVVPLGGRENLKLRIMADGALRNVNKDVLPVDEISESME
ncbi:hypothetical protein [Bradyrhizobium arachidis]|uniref:Uncharacterized protein n=1 Tax=Bradyrhizobium arachidis TaxID=858423 RepID=A0AAE7NJT2_9BRAD|nr:hypothetical protein [Bradyrhizobium arachidis]QOZ66612.1 hypothetical protein WN72_09680 [Bradyrhizobium arachidis]SFV17356.1 hypothetical protein SAMN05192541_12839 [Bradyrhizobium arachidis]